MYRLIRNLFAARTNRSPRTRPGRPHTSRLSVERMEERDCPSAAQLLAHARQFARDAYTVEYYQPTVMARTIVQDLIEIDTAARSNNVPQVVTEFQELYQHLVQEAYYVRANGWADRYALLSNNTIVSELSTIGYDIQTIYSTPNAYPWDFVRVVNGGANGGTQSTATSLDIWGFVRQANGLA